MEEMDIGVLDEFMKPLHGNIMYQLRSAQEPRSSNIFLEEDPHEPACLSIDFTYFEAWRIRAYGYASNFHGEIMQNLHYSHMIS